MADSPPGISAAPKDDNLRHFDVSVAGPGQSPYEGESPSSLAQRTAARSLVHLPSPRRAFRKM